MFIDFIISRILRISRKNNFPINFLRVSGSFIKEFLEFPEFFDYRVFFIVSGNWFIQLWNSSNFLLSFSKLKVRKALVFFICPSDVKIKNLVLAHLTFFSFNLQNDVEEMKKAEKLRIAELGSMTASRERLAQEKSDLEKTLGMLQVCSNNFKTAMTSFQLT